MAVSSETKAIKTTFEGEQFTVLFDSRPEFSPLVVDEKGNVMLSSEKTNAIISKI